MAAVGSQAVHQVLNQMTFKCLKCHQSANVDLRVFPCLHYACSACIVRYYEDPYSTNTTFNCPACNARVPVPREGLPKHRDAMETNRKLADLQQNLQGMHIPVAREDAEQPLEDFTHLLEDDERCECKCHGSCRQCGAEVVNVCQSVGKYLRSGDTVGGGYWWLLLPCWLCCFVKSIKPCCAVYNPAGRVEPESAGIKMMRKNARKAVVANQLPIFPRPLMHLWAFLMLFCVLCFTAVDIYRIVFAEDWMFWAVSCSGNVLLSLMWLVFVSVNLVKYRSQSEGRQARGESNYFTYFSMEQIQQFASELSVYPTLCVSAMQLPKARSFDIAAFALAAAILSVVFAFRFVTFVKLKMFLLSFYRRLLSSFAGNFVGVLALVGVLLFVSFQEANQIIQYSLVFLICITTIWNQYFFYISHLYEISLQSGVNILCLKAGDEYLIKTHITKLKSFDAFIKTMYPMSIPLYGMLLYFWCLPYLVVLTLFYVYGDGQLIQFSLFCGYLAWNMVVNHKTCLLLLAGHFTFLVIFALIMLIVFLSLTMAALIYLPATIVLIGWCAFVGAAGFVVLVQSCCLSSDS